MGQPIVGIMTIEEFDILLSILNADREGIILAKRPEYTEGKTDVLTNFKQVAGELGLDPLHVWYVYFRKHISSILTYIKNPKAAPPSREPDSPSKLPEEGGSEITPTQLAIIMAEQYYCGRMEATEGIVTGRLPDFERIKAGAKRQASAPTFYSGFIPEALGILNRK